MSDSDTAHKLMVMARQVAMVSVHLGVAAGTAHDDPSKVTNFNLDEHAAVLRAAAAVLDEAAAAGSGTPEAS
jgi:hypothetical protein